MNRPIKFEFIETVAGESTITSWDVIKIWDEGELEKVIKQYPHQLRWFTGLLDKNGKEIYENDLLKIDMEKFGVSDTVYQVIWDTDGWALKDLSDDTLPAYIFHDKDRQEVIGNIYENPELLA